MSELRSKARREQFRHYLFQNIGAAIAVAKYASHDHDLIVEAIVLACAEQGIKRAELNEAFERLDV